MGGVGVRLEHSRRFADRADAGRALADRIAALPLERPVVLALPRGGVPVGFEIARRLGAPLDVVAVRKIGAPLQPELGIGAVAEGRSIVLDHALIEELDLAPADVERVTERAIAELDAAQQRFHLGRIPDLAGRAAIIVDDGIATGGTVRAALRAARERGATELVVATPVAPPAVCDRLAREVDRVVVLQTPDEMRAVGLWYDDFTQVGDDEVIRLLEEAWPARAGGEPCGDPERAGTVRIPVGDHIRLTGDVRVPRGARGLVVFAHGSGSSRHSPRNVAVANTLCAEGLGTLLFDLLEPDEADDRRAVFDIDLLAERLRAALHWIDTETDLRDLPIALFGASTGAAAALVAAAAEPSVRTVVSRGGRPDLAGTHLPHVTCPVLLLVGGADVEVLTLNRSAMESLGGPCELRVIEGATHLFPEPGALERVADAAADWFVRHLSRPS